MPCNLNAVGFLLLLIVIGALAMITVACQASLRWAGSDGTLIERDE